MLPNQINILEDILQTITASESPDQSLDIIVSMVVDRFAVDVCSVYVYDPSENSLVLRAEVNRLENAFSQSAVQISQALDQAEDISDQESAIIEAHLMSLKDKSLRGKIIANIEGGNCAEYALKQVIMEYVDMFKSIEDAYLSERSEDMLNIGYRVLRNLLGVNSDPHQAFLKDTIVIAAELSPVDLLAIRQPNLKGIVLAKGGRTSHTVILAKSFEIPIVIGVDGLLEAVHEKDYVIVDGASGLVYANPSSEIRAEYERRKGETEKAGEKLSALRDLPAMTTCGFSMRLGANIGLLSDIALAEKYGADHIGLYRTEFPFLLRKTFPNEKEQLALYTRAIQKTGGLSVTIRTFDVGGDKFLPYLHYPKSVCRRFEKPVSICGEAASQLPCILLFVGMGADSLSMTPSSIPAAKKFIRGLNRSSAKEILDTVLDMEDADTVSRYLTKYIPA